MAAATSPPRGSHLGAAEPQTAPGTHPVEADSTPLRLRRLRATVSTMTPNQGPSNAASRPSTAFCRGRSDAAANGNKPLSKGGTGDDGDTTLLTGGYRNTNI